MKVQQVQKVRRFVSRVTGAVSGAWLGVCVTTMTASAQLVDVAPNSGVPGGAIVGTLLGWAKYVALAVCAAVVIAGGAMMGLSDSQSFGGREATGKKMLIGGFIGAIVTALAIVGVNGVYSAGTGAPTVTTVGG